MIKYCCYYCKKVNSDVCTGCYNALGGKQHLDWCIEKKVCDVENNECKEEFPFSKIKHSECWEEQSNV